MEIAIDQFVMTVMISCMDFNLLCRLQRKRTPMNVAERLIALAGDLFGPGRLAILWVCRPTVYSRWCHEHELWDKWRDAGRYSGPYPIIAHPPCGPWGKLKGQSRESKEHGIKAVEFARKYRGIVEHPVGSSLFREFATDAVIVRFNQGDFGFQTPKPTELAIFA